MQNSYAVRWREPDGSRYLGRLELDPKAMLLQGRRDGGRAVARSIGYDELRGLHIGRKPGERLDGQPALVIERARGAFLVASAVTQVGILQELVHRLSELPRSWPARLASLSCSMAEAEPHNRAGNPHPVCDTPQWQTAVPRLPSTYELREQGRRKMRRLFQIGGVIAGVVLIGFGVVAIYMGIDGRNTVRNSIQQEQIVFGAADDPAVAKYASKWAEEPVETGTQARAFAQVIREHALEGSGGLTYAQMGRFVSADDPDDPAGTSDEAAALKDEEGNPVSNSARNTWLDGHRALDGAQRELHGRAAGALRDRRRRRPAAERHRVRDPRAGWGTASARVVAGRSSKRVAYHEGGRRLTSSQQTNEGGSGRPRLVALPAGKPRREAVADDASLCGPDRARIGSRPPTVASTTETEERRRMISRARPEH